MDSIPVEMANDIVWRFYNSLFSEDESSDDSTAGEEEKAESETATPNTSPAKKRDRDDSPEKSLSPLYKIRSTKSKRPKIEDRDDLTDQERHKKINGRDNAETEEVTCSNASTTEASDNDETPLKDNSKKTPEKATKKNGGRTSIFFNSPPNAVKEYWTSDESSCSDSEATPKSNLPSRPSRYQPRRRESLLYDMGPSSHRPRLSHRPRTRSIRRFTREDVTNLVDGVNKFTKAGTIQWRSILSKYNFQPEVTAMMLKDKWRNLVRYDHVTCSSGQWKVVTAT